MKTGYRNGSKESISKKLKDEVWYHHNGNKSEVICPCCNIYPIYSVNFDCGHMLAEINGGKTDVKNLIPICHKCNCSMATESYDVFRKILNGDQDSNRISEMLQIKVWFEYFDNSEKQKCTCCMDTNIKISNFKCAMIINKKNNGKINLNNLCPVCNHCYKKLLHKDIYEIYNVFKKPNKTQPVKHKKICCFSCCW